MCYQVVPMRDQATEGVLGTVKKVMLTKLANIPNCVPSAKKALRIEKEKEKRQLIINEANNCLVYHSGMMRLSYLHPRIMEGFTLYWNGDSMATFMHKFYSRIDKGVEIDRIEKEIERRLSIMALQ